PCIRVPPSHTAQSATSGVDEIGAIGSGALPRGRLARLCLLILICPGWPRSFAHVPDDGVLIVVGLCVPLHVGRPDRLRPGSVRAQRHAMPSFAHRVTSSSSTRTLSSSVSIRRGCNGSRLLSGASPAPSLSSNVSIVGNPFCAPSLVTLSEGASVTLSFTVEESQATPSVCSVVRANGKNHALPEQRNGCFFIIIILLSRSARSHS